MVDQTEFSTSGSLGNPANAETITPADTDLANFTKAIYVGGTGDLAVMMADDQGDSIVVFKAVPVGTTLNIRCKQIRTTDTTASLIVALF